MNLAFKAWRWVLGQAGRFFPGEEIWARDWDICCVLDGCRSDTFREVVDADADVMRSVASTSQTWLPRTFGNRDNSSTAYITGNPYADRLDLEGFAYAHLEPVADVDNIETVDPAALTERAVNVWRRRDELGVDKLVVHYMQPHVPFRSRPEWFDQWRDTDTWGSSLWHDLKEGDLEHGELFDAYRDNLRWVMEAGVEPLSHNVTANIAVTADHGNAAGEGFIYGHPRGVPTPSLRRVPWYEIEARDHKTVTPQTQSPQTEYDRTDQLAALGYAEGDD